LGDTYHLAIGQGFLAVTPIQVNQMTNIVANDGIKCQLSILKDTAKKCQNIGIKKSTIDLIKTGMIRACQPGGTAYPLYNFKTAIACKTGTAEVGEEEGTTHAWLTAYAPADDPQISVTVMVEKGGEGSDTAAPIVGDILKEWFNEPNTVVPRKIGVSLGG
jgi:penicillin-binding protein 2